MFLIETQTITGSAATQGVCVASGETWDSASTLKGSGEQTVEHCSQQCFSLSPEPHPPQRHAYENKIRP